MWAKGRHKNTPRCTLSPHGHTHPGQARRVAGGPVTPSQTLDDSPQKLPDAAEPSEPSLPHWGAAPCICCASISHSARLVASSGLALGGQALPCRDRNLPVPAAPTRQSPLLTPSPSRPVHLLRPHSCPGVISKAHTPESLSGFVSSSPGRRCSPLSFSSF